MRSAVVITALIIAILSIIFNLTFTPSSQRQNIGMHENRKLKINDPYYE
jgi:lipopolysaccharide export LptBFGC system permease protein LptF